jgi:hypothetical protein
MIVSGSTFKSSVYETRSPGLRVERQTHRHTHVHIYGQHGDFIAHLSDIFKGGKLKNTKIPAFRTLRLKCIYFVHLIFYKPGN